MKRPVALVLVVAASFAAGRAIHGAFRSVSFTSLLPALQVRELQRNSTNDSAVVSINADPWSPSPSPWSPPSDPWSPSPNPNEEDELNSAQQEAIWCKAVDRGTRLMRAMMMNDQEAQTLLDWPYVQSPWDGDLVPELRKWGYLDDEELHEANDDECDFAVTHEMGHVFNDLRVDPRSAGEGGPNSCFYFTHMNGPTVIRNEDGGLPFGENQRYEADGKVYRVTEAYAKIGANPIDGIIYFLHRESPEKAATAIWGRRPNEDELPALRSSSDIAWGVWNRVAAANLRVLNYFMSLQIVNDDTQYIMRRALSQYNIATVPPWPGVDFQFAALTGKELEMEAALAILGSPNGLGVGYFIIQHRRQLGWKYVHKVKIFIAGEGVWALPNMMFYVSDQAPFEGPSQLDEQLQNLYTAKQRRKRDLEREHESGEVLYSSNKGKNVLREHAFVAKL